ncbi:MAG: CidA/LrgA family protein [Oliverpabstia sp.]|nr:CidA/LrgA family protein [Lachnospiraceae bacterium]MDY5026371.1 CidA/LrgA family protein [Oliverpabstia sp.]
MKYVRQFAIILLFSFLGEILHVIIPLSIPASVYGLVLLLAALCIKIVKVEQVQEGAGFLIEIMPVMFIPAAVGLLTSWELLKPICIPVIVITVVTTVIVMVSTGMVTQGIIRKERKKEEQDQ